MTSHRPRGAVCRPIDIVLAALAFLPAVAALASDLPETIDRVRPSIVVVGTHAPLRQPDAHFMGTGFVVGDGRHVLTNAHVLPEDLDSETNERLVVFTGRGERVRPRPAEIVARDREHDLALLRTPGERLPPMTLDRSDDVRAGQRFAFTGFPIGMVLGMYPVTHEALVSSVTPIAIPQGNSRQLDAELIRRLSDPYAVFQLDATAYPGNSGSPLYHPDSGEVVGVVNMVFVKRTKESVLQDPSGIAYAIPIRYGRRLLEQVREE